MGCFVVCKDKILLLYRAEKEEQPFTWGQPAGGVESGEELVTAMQRELLEETGLQAPIGHLQSLGPVYVRSDKGRDFLFHMFRWDVDQEPVVTVNPAEHSKHCWVTIEEALKMDNLIHDLDGCIRAGLADL